MNNSKVDEVFKKYVDFLKKLGHEPIRATPGEAVKSPFADEDAGAHLLWMCQEALSWPAERIEKKFRWLGFVQGALWRGGLCTIQELKEDNMPTEEKTDA